MNRLRPISRSKADFIPLLLLLLWVLSYGTIEASEDSLIHLAPHTLDSGDPIEAFRYMSVWINEGAAVTPEEMLQGRYLSHFNRMRDTPSYGYRKNAEVWLHLKIFSSLQNDQDIVFESRYPLLDTISIYFKDSRGHLEKMVIGDAVADGARKSHSRVPNGTVTLTPGENIFYIKVEQKGAFILPFYLWNPSDFQRFMMLDSIQIWSMLGCLFALFIYNFFLTLAFRSRAYFYYTLFIASMIGTQFSLQGIWRILVDHHLSTYLMNSWFIAIVSLTNAFAILFSMRFLDLKKSMPKANLILAIFIGSQVCFIFLTYLVDYETIVRPMTFFLLGSSLYLIYVSAQRAWNGYTPAVYFLLAWSFILLANFFNGLLYNGAFFSNSLVQFSNLPGAMLEGILMSLALGERITYNRRLTSRQLELQNKEITFLNQNLERLAAYRAQKIQTLLDSLPQGVLSIEASMTIGQEFSKNLPDLLGHPVQESDNFVETLIQHADLDEDEKDQVLQTIHAIVGEESVAYELNADKLPKTFRYRLGHVNKVFQLTWSPVILHSITERLLVTILDVTEEHRLLNEAEVMKKELQYVQELLEIEEGVTNKFFLSVGQMINDMRSFVLSGEARDAFSHDELKHVFSILHTIKGTARTIGLRDLSNLVHQVESKLSDNDPAQPLKSYREVSGYIDEVDRLFGKYKQICSTKLNRLISTDRILVERKFIASLLSKLGSYKKREKVDFPFESELKTLQFFARQETERYFLELSKKAAAIARDMGKPAPEVRIRNEAGILLSIETQIVFDSIMIHLLRNSLDHGVESELERAAKGKSRSGLIEIEFGGDNLRMTIRYSDDGRGIAVGKLKRMAQGKAQAVEGLTPEQIANLIFESGFSTADEVTQFSGRGVGVHAVKILLEENRGNISLLLGKPKDTTEEFFDFCFYITLEQPSLNEGVIESNHAA